MPFNRSMAEVIKAHGDAIRDDIRVMLPAVITAVHPGRQTVDVKITVQNPLFDEYGEASFEELPGISDVPVGVMRGGNFLIWIPVAVGDSVMLVFSDLSMDNWRAASSSQPVEPGWLGKHTFDSPVAIPCIAPDAKFFADPNAIPGKIIIGKDGSQAQIRISDTEIDLGATPTSPLALSSPLLTYLGDLQAQVNALSQWAAAIQAWLAVASPLIPDSVPPVLPALVAPTISTAATIVTATATADASATVAQTNVPTTQSKGQ